ncbi:MAG: PDDEXK nuclease domain-containing protein [Candidatus Methylomirabilis sp.]|nr:PDDEXK nuclease domain-containing protein [Deltaproteobacteria bacterium]
MAKKTLTGKSHRLAGYDKVLGGVAELLESARRASARATNAVMTATYWEIGRRIVEYEQSGEKRAEYGTALLKRMSFDLTARFGRGFSERNLEQMRLFYLGWQISQTASAKLQKGQTVSDLSLIVEENQPVEIILQTPSGKSLSDSTQAILQTASAQFSLSQIAARFPLPWSHYVRLLSLKSVEARVFYEKEALRGGWTVRQLERQIESQFYERTMLSKNKAAMLRKGGRQLPEDLLTPEEEIKDPFMLEFLGLKDEYSENDLEEALVRQVEHFLLELGGDFAFIGRQRRLRVGDEWYRVDLLFFHRRLRCLVIIDLKLGKFTHADAGQMHLYLNYAREHWSHPDENPPVGLILCAQKDHAVARYALEGLPNKVLAAEYRTALPDEKMLEAEVDKTRKIIEKRAVLKTGRRGRR